MTSGPTRVRVEALAPEHLPGLRALFDAASSACFCRWWHFGGNKNEWLDRCAHRPDENAAELEQAVRAHELGARGLVAIAEDGRIVGWLKLTPLAAVPKLRALPVYRNLDLGDATTTYAVGCVLVDPPLRRTGVARALALAVPAFAKRWAASAVVAFPRRAHAALSDEEAWQGPEALLRATGFEPLHDVDPYPVLRRSSEG